MQLNKIHEKYLHSIIGGAQGTATGGETGESAWDWMTLDKG